MNHLIKVNDAEIPEIFYSPKKVGIELLDNMFSVYGGLIPSMAYMFTGSSGAGKTTISNYIMAGMSSKESPAAFISLEMSKEQVKFQFEGKVNFENTLIVDAIESKTVEGFQAILDEIETHNPSVVVLDSLQFATQILFGSPVNVRGQSKIADMLLKFAKKNLVPVVVIGQCGKNGDYIGPSFIKHALDGHLHATYDEKTKVRTISFKKNRFGSVGEYVAYRFEKDGSLSFMTLDELKPSVVNQEFGWYKAKAIIENIYEDIIKSEIKMLVKKAIRIPVLKFEGTNKVEYGALDFHTNTNTWMDFPQEPYFIHNTVFVDVEYSKARFTEDNIEVLQNKFSEYLDRYPQFEKPSDIFILQFLILMTQAILADGEHNQKFWKTLDRIVLNHG